ncbi:hypothetical protein N7486_002427 [Penicillium sp. IBT 16267x]|nr:hypothetical protein N7486_002427 [Penicillium sp. IBT 16267x]
MAEAANYMLSTTIDGVQKYCAETTNGTGILVNTLLAADVYNGSGADDMDVQLIGNTVYITTRVNATATEKNNNLLVIFTKASASSATDETAKCIAVVVHSTKDNLFMTKGLFKSKLPIKQANSSWET